jgi:hypothetical protein
LNYSYAGTVKFMCVTYDASRTGLITTRRITAVGVGAGTAKAGIITAGECRKSGFTTNNRHNRDLQSSSGSKRDF